MRYPYLYLPLSLIPTPYPNPNPNPNPGSRPYLRGVGKGLVAVCLGWEVVQEARSLGVDHVGLLNGRLYRYVYVAEREESVMGLEFDPASKAADHGTHTPDPRP